MILSLLKNRRLRAQLFVALLLVLGTIPEEIEGFECYVCKASKEDKCETKKTCAHEKDATGVIDWACLKATAGGSFGRACAPKQYGECLVKLGYAKDGSSCGKVPIKELADVTSDEGFKAKMRKCTIELSTKGRLAELPSMEGRQGGDTSDSVQCVCHTELCNTSQQQQTPSSKLIISILIATGLYKYI